MAGSPIIGIGKNTVIENAIIDKNATYRRQRATDQQNSETDYISQNFEVRDGIIVVNKNAIIHSGTIF